MASSFNKIPVLLLGLLLLCGGCEKVITEDLPPHTPMVVCNSTFTDKAPFAFQLYRSKSILDTGRFTQLRDAWILIEEDGVFKEKVYFNNAIGLHVANLVPSGGKTYKIIIQEPDGTTNVTATSQLPAYPDIRTSDFKDSVGTDSSGSYYGEIRFRLRDPGVEGYYNVGVFYYNTSIQEYLPVDYDSNDPLLSPDVSYAQEDGTITFVNTTFSGQEREFVVTIPGGYYQTQPNFLLLIKKISPEYFKYQQSLALFEEVRDNPFAEPVQVYTNIENGLGIFAGYTAIGDTLR